MKIETIAVLGAGTMGRGIAHVSALAGCAVRLFDVQESTLTGGIAAIRKNLDKGVARGKVDAGDADAAFGRIAGVTSLEAAVTEADLVVEAVPEKLELKRSLFAQVDALASARDATVAACSTFNASRASSASARLSASAAAVCCRSFLSSRSAACASCTSAA